jgi:uncharacterized protein YegP (UPF0339 family)
MNSISRRTALTTAVAALATALVDPPVALASQRSSLKFEIYRDSKGGFRWRLKAANGRVIATSGEGYKAKADCKNAIESIKRGAATAAVEELS